MFNLNKLVDNYFMEDKGEMIGGSRWFHWESTVMGNDYMTSTVSSHMLISKITLALFEDSGWYMPDYTQAEDMWWGKNRGCDFISYDLCPMGEEQSDKTGEFCRYSDVKYSFGCDAWGDNMVQCSKTQSVYSENCPLSTEVDSLGQCDSPESIA